MYYSTNRTEITQKREQQGKRKHKDHLMPSKVTYEKRGAGVVVSWTGFVTGAEIKEVNASLKYAKEGLGKLRYQIWDFTQVDGKKISNQDVHEFAIQDRVAAQTNPDLMVALVGNKNSFEGYDRLFHIYEEVWAGFQSRTFSTIAEAREWISSRLAE